MDGFLKEDMVGSIKKGMTLDQIDTMVSRQLKMMEDDYEMCKKYDDPTYTGEPVVLQGTFEKSTFEDGTTFQNDKDYTQPNHSQASPLESSQHVVIPQNGQDEGDNENSDNEDNRCEQGYQPLNNDANGGGQEEEEDEWNEFQDVPDFKDLPAERDPRKKEIDYEKIRQIMSTFTLEPPSWASNKNVWESKVENLLKDTQN